MFVDHVNYFLDLLPRLPSPSLEFERRFLLKIYFDEARPEWLLVRVVVLEPITCEARFFLVSLRPENRLWVLRSQQNTLASHFCNLFEITAVRSRLILKEVMCGVTLKSMLLRRHL